MLKAGESNPKKVKRIIYGQATPDANGVATLYFTDYGLASGTPLLTTIDYRLASGTPLLTTIDYAVASVYSTNPLIIARILGSFSKIY